MLLWITKPERFRGSGFKNNFPIALSTQTKRNKSHRLRFRFHIFVYYLEQSNFTQCNFSNSRILLGLHESFNSNQASGFIIAALVNYPIRSLKFGIINGALDYDFLKLDGAGLSNRLPSCHKWQNKI